MPEPLEDPEWDQIVSQALEAEDDELHEVAGMTEEAFEALFSRPDDVNRKENGMDADPTQDPNPTDPTPEDQHVPYERFKQANDKAKALEAKLNELTAQVESFEDRDKSETERERKAREKAEQRAQELEGKVTQLERGGWVRAAASKHGFNDPSDALAFTDLSGVDDERSADRAVKRLADQKPHLLKAQGDEPPQIGRVLEGGKPTQGSSAAGGQITKEEWDRKYGAAILSEIDKARAHSTSTEDPLRGVFGQQQ